MEIAVEAAALNFKDVMNAMGLLPEAAVAGGLTAHRLGLEVAGRVLRTGRRGAACPGRRRGDRPRGRGLPRARDHAGPLRRASARTANADPGREHSRRLRHGLVFPLPPGASGRGRDGADPFGGRRRRRRGDPAGAARRRDRDRHGGHEGEASAPAASWASSTSSIRARSTSTTRSWRSPARSASTSSSIR